VDPLNFPPTQLTR
jgi:catechol 2,3-dioxygenase-like lactoylglutathione lyase family enzyme